MSKQTARTVYAAYTSALVVLFVGLGIMGFVKSDHTNYGVPGGATIQVGHVVEGQQHYDHFNEDVRLDTTQVSR